MADLGVTIAGLRLDHRLYHFRLAYSGFEHTHVVLGGESFVALAEGCRTPSGRSAACRASTAPTPLGRLPQSRQGRPGGSHPPLRSPVRPLRHDADPQQHGRRPREWFGRRPAWPLKRAIADALLLRAQHGLPRPDRLPHLRRRTRRTPQCPPGQAHRQRAGCPGGLPERRSCDYEQVSVRVSSAGGFRLRKVFYTVPSRLIGHTLRVRLYDDRLDVFVGGSHLLPCRGAGSSGRTA